MGELGRLFVECDRLPVQYEVITVENLRRDTPLAGQPEREGGRTI